MFLAYYFLLLKGKEIDSILFYNGIMNLLLSQFIKELMGQGLCSIQSLLWRVYHQLANQA